MTIKTILIYRIDRLGDLIYTTPAIQSLRNHYPNAKIIAILSTYNSKALHLVDFIDEIILYDRHKPLREKLKTIQFIRKKKADLAVVFSPGNHSFRLATLSRARLKYGLITTKKPLKTWIWRTFFHVFSPEKPLLHRDECNQVTQLIDSNIKIVKSYKIGRSPEMKRHWEKTLMENKITNPWIGIHCDERWFTRMKLNNSSFNELVQQLISHFKCPVIIATAGQVNIQNINGTPLSLNPVHQNNTQRPSKPTAHTLKHPDFFLWTEFINSCQMLLTPHGGATAVAEATNTPIVDIAICSHTSNYYNKWQPQHQHVVSIVSSQTQNELRDEIFRGVKQLHSSLFHKDECVQ